jgi:radical SAM superfamily enzyme YgiQ (UPF0313 family)
MNLAKETFKEEKILLVLLPFWTPLIPPMGIACLKSYLVSHGYRVRTVDVNVELDSMEFYENYFNTLKTFIPEQQRGNFYNTGRELLRNHMMAQEREPDESDYIQLVKEMIYKSYYVEIDNLRVRQLNRVLADFYSWLASYFLDLLKREKPTVLGLSVYNGTLPASLFAFKLARQVNPNLRNIMGGGIFADQLCMNSPNWGPFLEETKDYIDTLIVGEGEILFRKWLEQEFPTKSSGRVLTREDIDGETMDITAARVPDLWDFNLVNYPYLVSYTSRSCPFQCSFCSETLQWGKYRKKQPGQIVQELKELYHRHGYQLFLMCDSLINPVITPLAREFIGEDLSLYWESCIRADKEVCNTDNTLLWRQGGFYKARIGIESGSPHVLDLMNKKITPRQIKDAVCSLAYAGIKTLTFWIIGHPGETEEDFQQTLDLIEELRDEIYEAEGTPFLYFPTGQSNSEGWMSQYPRRLLYSRDKRNVLLTRTWILEAEPSREVIYQRSNRFIQHLDKLGIPHPYSLSEIYKADERWKTLHSNAVPSLMEFGNPQQPLDETKHIKIFTRMQKTIQDDGDFSF